MNNKSLPDFVSTVAEMLPDDLTFSYKATLKSGYLTHQWELTGPRGGIHVMARPDSLRDGREWLGGIEGHSPKPREYDGETPHHEHCWLLQGPCWHDGSSLQFSEQIGPYLPYQDQPMSKYHHDMVLSQMLSRYRSWLPEAEKADA